jgi:DNA-binding MarR family transcriptional regulator
MNQHAPWIGAAVDRDIASLEKRVSAIKQELFESRLRTAAEAAVSEVEVRALLQARRTREKIIGCELFADPAWDILLELYAASLGQRRVSTSELTVASAVSATTALRWIDKLESLGLLQRQGDPLDGRRMWNKLSAEGEEKMRSCLREIFVLI